ncbi:MAG: hypothetical protein LBE85_07425 [Candidatus Accumulibacter sp.]|nr:hypothetical protein [Accumulibacter sp.]
MIFGSFHTCGGASIPDGGGFRPVGEIGAGAAFSASVHDPQAAQEFERLIVFPAIPASFRPPFPQIGEEIHHSGVADEGGAHDLV